MTSQNISLSDTKIVSLIKQEKLALSSTAPLSQASEPKWTIRPWSWHKNTNIINYNFKIMETSHCRYKTQHDFTTAWPTSHPFRLFKEVWENWQLSRDAIIIYGNTSKKKTGSKDEWQLSKWCLSCQVSEWRVEQSITYCTVCFIFEHILSWPYRCENVDKWNCGMAFFHPTVVPTEGQKDLLGCYF